MFFILLKKQKKIKFFCFVLFLIRRDKLKHEVNNLINSSNVFNFLQVNLKKTIKQKKTIKHKKLKNIKILIKNCYIVFAIFTM